MKNRTLRKMWVWITAATLTATMLAGCGDTSEQNSTGNNENRQISETESSSAAESSAASEQTPEPAASGERKLVVYSNTDEAGATAMEEAGAEIGIEVTIVRLGGGGDVIDRVMAEKNNPTADIVYGSNHIGLARLKAADCLEQFVPVWDDKVDEGLKDPDDYYYGVGISAVLLAYNPEVVGDNVPTDWTDLWTVPEWQGKYFVNPSTSVPLSLSYQES